MLQFRLISWCWNFMERHSFRIASGESPETMRKLRLSVKYPYQEIRWNCGILRSACSSVSIVNFEHVNASCVVVSINSLSPPLKQKIDQLSHDWIQFVMCNIRQRKEKQTWKLKNLYFLNLIRLLWQLQF